GSHVLEALGRQQHGRSGKSDHGGALTIAQGLRADGLAGYGIDDADEIRRHGAGPAIEPGHGELVLEGEAHGVAAEIVEALDGRRPAQEALGGAAIHVLELAREAALPPLARQY